MIVKEGIKLFYKGFSLIVCRIGIKSKVEVEKSRKLEREGIIVYIFESELKRE